MKTQHSPPKVSLLEPTNQQTQYPLGKKGRGWKGLRFVRGTTEAEGKVETCPGDLLLHPSAQGFLLSLPSGVGTS